MNNSYFNKYHNIKYNYNQKGGSLKSNIFDLSKSYPQFKKNQLQNNIKLFIKEFGNKFILKYNNKKVDIEIKEMTLLNKTKFYRLIYDIPKRTTKLIPLVIDFIDLFSGELNNNTYIASIQKSETFSGSELVKIALKINEILGTHKTYLYDGTTVKCSENNETMDLSFIKLLEKNKTFYMKHGFEFDNTSRNSYLFYRFANKKQFNNFFNNLTEKIKKIKIQDIITEYENTLDLLNKITKENYKQTFEITLMNFEPPEYNEIYTENPKDKIKNIFEESEIVLKILHKYKKEKLLYKLLIKLFKDNCKDYTELVKYIIENKRNKIIYGKTTIYRKYIQDLHLFSNLRYSLYSYTFK